MSVMDARIVVVAALLLIGGVGRGAGPESSDRLRGLLENPPEGQAEGQAALLELDATEISALCALLRPAGTEGGARVRTILHGLAICCAPPERAKQRDAFVSAVLHALGGDSPAADPAFLIRQLRWIGADDLHPALRDGLRDEVTCHAAAAVLIEIDSPAARAALGAALHEAEGRCLLASIDALATLGDDAHLARLMELTRSEDEDVRLAALHALACSGSVEVEQVLRDAAESKDGFAKQRTRGLLIEYARRLAEDGRGQQAGEIYRGLLRGELAAGVHLQCAALVGLHEALGMLGAESVLAALTDENAQVRAVAFDLATSEPQQWMTLACTQAFDTANADERIALLRVLGARDDEAGLATILGALEVADAQVREAAIVTAGQQTHSPIQIVTSLVDRLRDSDEGERRAIRAALISLDGDRATRALARFCLMVESPDVRVALLQVLAERPPTDDLNAVLRAARSGNEDVRGAALDAAAALAQPQHVPELLTLLRTAANVRDRSAAGAAVAAVANRHRQDVSVAELVIETLRAPELDLPVRMTLLRVLGRVGGEAAQRIVVDTLDSDEDELREAAVRALGDWPSDEPAGATLAFVRRTEVTREYVLALRAYVRMIGMAEHRPAAETVEMCEAALEAARRPDEEQLVLAQLGQVASAEALPALRRYLGNKTLGDEAAAAAVNVVDALLPEKWPLVRAPLEDILAHHPPEHVERRARKLLAELEQFEGFVTDWWVSGPYTVGGVPGNELMDDAFAPERALSAAEWRAQPVHDDPREAWRINLHATMAGDHRAGYLFTRVYAPTAQMARLELGSDDGLKVWLNGELVHENNALRGVTRGEDVVPARLEEGWNRLLLKVTNNGGAWSACARIAGPDGKMLDGVYADAGEKP